VRIAALQLNSQGLSSTKLYNYIRIAHKKGVRVLVLGEYVLNPFFKELQKLSVEMIKSQADLQMKVLKESAKDYNLTIIAPLITVKKKKLYKTIIKFSPKSISYYYQQLLINYPHWDENRFFSNETNSLKAPMIFQVDKFRFGVCNGFELHFDDIFKFFDEKNIDALLVPSSSTFNSNLRWQNLVQTRAFTHNIYILRVNRIGSYKDKELSWDFYGDSMLISPNGELLNKLRNEEELMIVDLNHKEVLEARKNWKFKEILNKITYNPTSNLN
jgi:predicted amidohydrolase